MTEQTQKTQRVLIVDDERLARVELSTMLAAHADVEVAGLADVAVPTLEAVDTCASRQMTVLPRAAGVACAAGDRLQVGSTVLRITAEPHRGCGKFKQRFGSDALEFVNSRLGDKHRLRGVYAKIISAGEVCVDDTILKLNPAS